MATTRYNQNIYRPMNAANNINMDTFPEVSPQLLQALETLFPEKCAKVGDKMDEIMHYSGKRDIINFLQFIHKQQTARHEKI